MGGDMGPEVKAAADQLCDLKVVAQHVLVSVYTSA